MNGTDKLYKQKIGTNDPNKLLKIYKKIFPTVAFNVCITSFPVLIMDFIYHGYSEFSISGTFVHIVLGALASEILFYIFHRIMHIPYLYKRYHKIHHELKEPIGMGALYTHWIDSLFGNILPNSLYFYVVRVHPYTLYIWTIISTSYTTLVAHSNYKNLSEFHDTHHRKTYVNYSNGLFMDKLFGTDDSSRNWIYEETNWNYYELDGNYPNNAFSEEVKS